jgi:hypothetical protein
MADTATPPTTAVTGTVAQTDKRPARWHTVLSIALLVVAIVLAPLFVMSVWVKGEVTDTGRYLKTVAPLADNPDVQQYVAAQLSSAVIDTLDLQTRVTELLPPQLSGLAPTLANAADGFITTAANRFTTSDAFKEIWVDANRAAHELIVKVLTGNPDSVHLQNGQLTLDLGTALQKFQAYLVGRGFDLASKLDLSKVNKQIVIAEGPQLQKLEKARRVVSLLKPLVWVLGILFIAASVGSVLLARDRRYAGIRLGLGLAGIMMVILVAINFARRAFLNALTGQIVPKRVSAALFDSVATSLRTGFRVVFWGALIVVLLVLLLPQIARRAALVRPVQAVVIVAAAALLLTWDNPTWAGIIVLLIAAAAVVVAIELAHRRFEAERDAIEPPPTPPSEPEPTPAGT